MGILTIVQILQAIKQGIQIQDISTRLGGLEVNMDKLLELVGDRTTTDSSPTEIIQATVDSLMNTPVDAIFVSAGESETIVGTPPEDEPPTDGILV